MDPKKKYIAKQEKAVSSLEKKVKKTKGGVKGKKKLPEMVKKYSRRLTPQLKEAKQNLKKLKEADVTHWEDRRIQLRDSLTALRRSLAEVNGRMKNA